MNQSECITSQLRIFYWLLTSDCENYSPIPRPAGPAWTSPLLTHLSDPSPRTLTFSRTAPAAGRCRHSPGTFLPEPFLFYSFFSRVFTKNTPALPPVLAYRHLFNEAFPDLSTPLPQHPKSHTHPLLCCSFSLSH